MNYKEVLNKAKEEKFAIPQFNANNLEFTKWILEACEEMHSPVILGFSEGAIRYIGGVNTVAQMVKGLKKDLQITVPVFLHLDHGSSLESCIDCYNAGFDSVMLDASSKPLEENIILTNKVIDSCPIVVESEIGAINANSYANEDECKAMVERANISMLAIAVGNVHGLYKTEPNIQFDLIERIRYSTNMPLVLHGGTGLSDEILKECITKGICKININTELQVAWHKSLLEYIENNREIYDPRKNIGSGMDSVKEAIKHKIMVIGSNDRVN